ncbi:MAG: hypothetical protein ACFCUJ_10630 [Thiotrichales bacterium]
MGKKSSSGVDYDAYLTVEIRTASAVLAAQIDVLRAKRRHGGRCDTQALISRPSANLGRCVYCLADRIKTHSPELRTSTDCVANPMLFQVIEQLDPGSRGTRLALSTALERLSDTLRHLETLDDEQLVVLRDFLVDVSNQGHGTMTAVAAHNDRARPDWGDRPVMLQ